MMKTARNSIKGYTYQQVVFVLLLALMDTERRIKKIEVEAIDTKNFDDIYIECVNDYELSPAYRFQVKNYPNTKLSDIDVTESTVKIKGSQNSYEATDSNILVINTNEIPTDDSFMGLPSTTKNGIIIIPLTIEQIITKLDNMFSMESREIQIINLAEKVTIDAKFEITVEELPSLSQMSIELDDETVILQRAPQDIQRGINFIEGKPGVGKSHFVNEIVEKFPDSLVYRFWTGAQDPNINRRIHFNVFLVEMGIKVFHTARKFTINQLVEKIISDDKLIVIDGLDHVENYNPREIGEFISFIDKLSDAKVIVLSRPISTKIHWKKKELMNWTFDEMSLYLNKAHEIKDYEVQRQIFTITGGYPIITYFFAENYKINKKIDCDEPIKSINDYYDTLFHNNEKPSSIISVFATGNCFFTWNELKTFYSDPEMSEVLYEFIELHPYLFNILMNRISLIHDSFNTYLREKLTTVNARGEKVLAIVRESILSGSFEYMTRMSSFDLGEEFYRKILIKYSDINEFRKLALSTRDYNSIMSFYKQLREILEVREDVLDIYQYYSFALLYQIATRNDLVGDDSLVYQMLLYMHEHDGIEDNIFSSDYIWQVYLACVGQEKITMKYLKNRNISDSQFYDMIEHINEDNQFFKKKDNIITYDSVEAKFVENENNNIKKQKILTDYLVSVWIHGKSEDKFFDEFRSYIDGEKFIKYYFLDELAKYGLDLFWINGSLNTAQYNLHELGYLGEKNRFRKNNIKKIVRLCAPKGSFGVATNVASYLKLANYEKRKVDIEELSSFWTMYYEHKDASVQTIGEALICFENKGLIQEKESVKSIERLMEQSDKGIRHLLTEYINLKETSCIDILISNGYFDKPDNHIIFWELSPENIDRFSKKQMQDEITKILSRFYHSRTLEGRDMRNVMKSKYADMLLDGIEYFEYSVLSPDDNLIPILEERGIKYIGENTTITEETYIPFKYGNIHEKDFNYIQTQKIGYLDVAKYTDGWYNCMPYVDVYELYNRDDIQNDYLKIIHKSMFARIGSLNYVGDWSLLLGNIPSFLLKYEIDVDWDKIFDIFKGFLELSLIWHET